MASDRHDQRLALGHAAVFSLMHAAELLPIADKEARAWLRRQGLVRRLLGKEVVIWGEVVDRLREASAAPESTNTLTTLKRVRLD